ncbi:ribonuclease pancreatic-like [Talpa occidentalis]|uniref:ribonuclease pancreatic-like n=1 Tax=Talpa occidentalis TaxID=50954 RepID=UPI00188F43E0|nr:ribonuclease pancreatic-like [Talpa occidentalis]
MALNSLVLFSLLVLVLLVLVGARPSWPRETPAQRFQRQHVDFGKGPFGCTYCNQMMRRRNILGKAINTFVHEPLAAVQAICLEPDIPCKYRRNSCHKSRCGLQGSATTMALKSLVLFSLLGLVLLVLEGAWPSQLRETQAQRFQRQHVDSRRGPFGRTYCDQMMSSRNISTKQFNTFVHEPLAAVQAVCHQLNFPCKDGSMCRKSTSQMSITECDWNGATSHYNTINRMRRIVVACAGNPLEPIHYDGSVP